MLHGCTQDPDDFAAGTRMDAHAGAAGCLVLYPTQHARANGSKCWNWFKPGDQRRGDGEPARLAAMTRDTAVRYGADPDRIYVAGLSAGGAMAAILASEYPDIFAAAAVPSGPPSGPARGAAHDVASAFATMHKAPSARSGRRGSQKLTDQAPIIAFHGSADRTVHPAHGKHLAGLDSELPQGVMVARRQAEIAGRRVAVSVVRDGTGNTRAEHWSIDGLDHAWSGGSRAGSYADPKGPDASREMLRFFLAQRRTASRATA